MGILMYLALPYLLIAACFLLMTYREQTTEPDSWDCDTTAAAAPRPLALRALSCLLCLFWPIAVVAVGAALVLSATSQKPRQTTAARPAPASAS